jgi:hypothetical protein
MFDFEKLKVYRDAKDLNKEILKFPKQNKRIGSYIRDQSKMKSVDATMPEQPELKMEKNKLPDVLQSDELAHR